MRIKVKKVHPRALLPTKAYPGDLGYDLYALERVVLKPLRPVAVRTGVAVELPDGWGALVKDRSSLALKGIHALGGVIDNGYRGEIRVILVALAEEVVLEAGSKIAQLVPVRTTDWEIVEVEELSDSHRGERGFGSSGT
ncbi:MAG: dUTP diphosphatase [Thermotogae bacterium]|nr:dUTP diphosphatase [Thermotogota bacterium]